jgi:hypothetical protein
MHAVSETLVIRCRITFIVGAGASRPYGLPLGCELVAKAKELRPQDHLYQHMNRLGVRVETLNDVLKDLRSHPGESLDDFIRTRAFDPDTVRVGRLLIAGLMGDALRSPEKPDPKRDWLGYLLGKMVKGADSLEGFLASSRVQFVTFNFDTVIEHRIKEFLADYFKRGPFERVAEGVPVTHLHGRLDGVPGHPMGDDMDILTRDWSPWLDASASNVRVVGDQLPDEVRMRAIRAMADASRLCFLGFGYDEQNIRQLELESVLSDPSSEKRLFGTAMGLKEGEQERIKNLLPGPRIYLGGEDIDCLLMLQHSPVLA